MMSHTKLHECAEEAESHAKLERVLKSGGHPLAECRVHVEEGTSKRTYCVWSGPAEPHTRPVEERPPPDKPTMSDAEAEIIARKVAELLRKGKR